MSLVNHAWNAFGNVIDAGTSNFRAIGGIGFRVPLHGMRLKM